MYTRKRKPNWLLYATVLLIILFVCLCLLIKSEPIKVVVSDKKVDQNLCTKDVTSLGQNKEKYNITAGVFNQSYIYLDQSLLGDTQDNGVVVTDSQQGFCLYMEEEARAAVEAEEIHDEFLKDLTGNKFEEYMPTEYFELTEDEEYMLAKLVQCEAGNQGMKAKEAVVMTVLNRVYDERFPNTIEEVIFENHNGIYQFSPICDGSWDKNEPNESAYQAVINVQTIGSPPINDIFLEFDGLYFESCPDEDNWHSRNLDFVVQYDDIRFYK